GRGHICKHALASAGAPALVAIMQVRRAESYYELAFIEAAHSAMLNDIAPAFRSIFNAELLHAKRRLSDTIPEAA
ncbi:MAG TPA: hypothetical protein VNN73_17365, partial [Blastocatellia bacterium]|nr:hypothetical protein [Blastocatellia bacterium]